MKKISAAVVEAVISEMAEDDRLVLSEETEEMIRLVCASMEPTELHQLQEGPMTERDVLLFLCQVFFRVGWHARGLTEEASILDRLIEEE
jgi:hypothetical protein